jgi:uncharacterized protein YggE
MGVLISIFTLLSIGASTLRADANTGILVVGVGGAKSKPTLVEIGAQVSGEAELTADAIVKYRDARKQAVTAIENMKIPGLTLESDGFSVNQAVDDAARQAMMRGMPAPASKPRVAVMERLKLRLTGVEAMEPEALMDAVLKIIDTGRDAGLQVGPAQQYVNYYPPPPPPPLVNFKVPDPEQVRAEAYQKAMEDARKKAQRLAELAGVTLGPIVAVHEGDTTRQPDGTRIYYYQQESISNPQELSGGTYTPLAVTLKLTVQFEIQKSPTEAAAARE